MIGEIAPNDERWRCPFCDSMADRQTEELVICYSVTCACGAICLGAPPWDFDEIIDDAIKIFGPRIRSSSRGFDARLLQDLTNAGVEMREGVTKDDENGMTYQYCWFRHGSSK